MKKIFGICFFVLMTGCILTHSSLSLAYAALGLNLWYEKMVPAVSYTHLTLPTTSRV